MTAPRPMGAKGKRTMAKTQRVVFKFDERGLESTDKLKEQHGEFQEVTVHNPETGKERVILIGQKPPLRPHACTGHCWCMGGSV